jgi:hypothetical protein
MKYSLFPLLSGICFLPLNTQITKIEKPVISHHYLLGTEKGNEGLKINQQDDKGSSRMRSIVFKSQEYCRAELKDFEFDVHFTVVSATVYFTGKNFPTAEKATITSNSLKPLKNQVDRCVPGSIVIFDDVTVKGPDKLIRTIPGLSLVLY